MPTAARPRPDRTGDLARPGDPVRGLGLDLPRRSRSPSTRSRRSSWRRSASDSPASCSSGGSRCGDAATFRLPTRREVRDTSIVGALLLGGGMGMVAWGEQTIPSGIAALLDRPDAGVGRRARTALPRRAAAADRGHRHRGRVRRGRGPRRPDGARRERRPGCRRPGSHHRVADRLVDRLAVRLPSRGPAPASAHGDRQPDGGRVRRPRRDVRRDRRARPVRRDGRLDRVVRRLPLPDGRRQPAGVHDVRLDAPGGAAAPCRDLRVRQSRSSRSSSERSCLANRSGRGRSSPGRSSSAAVALIVTARGRMAGPRVAARRGHDSARTVRATRRAKAITVSIGLTPRAVGNSDESATYRPVTMRPSTASASNAPVRIARMLARDGAHPDRAHLVGREDRAAVRAEIHALDAILEPPECGRVGAGRAADRIEPDRGRCCDDDLARTSGPREAGHPYRRHGGASRHRRSRARSRSGPGRSGSASPGPAPPSRVTATSGARWRASRIDAACASVPSHGRASASRPGCPGADSMT